MGSRGDQSCATLSTVRRDCCQASHWSVDCLLRHKKHCTSSDQRTGQRGHSAPASLRDSDAAWRGLGSQIPRSRYGGAAVEPGERRRDRHHPPARRPALQCRLVCGEFVSQPHGPRNVLKKETGTHRHAARPVNALPPWLCRLCRGSASQYRGC